MFNLPVVFQRSSWRSLLRLLEPEDSWIIKADIKVSSFSKWKANFGAGLKSELLFILRKFEMKATVLGGANSEQCCYNLSKKKGQLCCGPVSEILPGSVSARTHRFAWRVQIAFTLEIYNQYWRWVKLIAACLLALLANWGGKGGKRLSNLQIPLVTWNILEISSVWHCLAAFGIWAYFLFLNLLFTDQCWLICELASRTLWPPWPRQPVCLCK